jgi:trigger factor
MKHSARESGSWQHTLDIEVPADEVETQLDLLAHSIQRRAVLPGFRRGKVPIDQVRQHFAEAIEQEFFEHFLPRATGEAIAEENLQPVVPPMVRNVRFTPGQPLRFEAIVDVRPQIEAKAYRGLPLKRRIQPVDDAAVERVLEGLREDSAVFADLDRPAREGDMVLVDSTRLDVNGKRLPGTVAKNRRVPLGDASVPSDLANGLVGAVAGQERTVEVKYPEDHSSPELAGHNFRYLLKVRKIQEKKLRPLDDNLAREVFQLESLAALKDRIRQNLEREEDVRVRREIEAAATDSLIQRHTLELPDRLVQWMMERVIGEATQGRPVNDQLRRDLETHYRPSVERSLRREFLLEAVARAEKLEVSDQDVADEIDRMAQADPRQAAKVRARYQSAERRSALRETVLERKAMDRLIELAEVQDEVAGETPLVVPAGR